MPCEFCNAKLTDQRLLATTRHVWARCCPVCTAKYGERDEQGALIYKEEAKHE